jgi:anti-sigma regulatory factor (Ser/Thr protein kinase)
VTSAIASPKVSEPFRHEALLYAGDDGFVDACTAFVREGWATGEAVLVVVVPRKIDLLRDTLGRDADGVLFADMAAIGRNPARIIPVWRRFVAEHGGPGKRVRGIGEPIWAGRGSEELVEAQRHESLINLAFSGARAWILCPYDTDALGEDVIAEALRSHPVVSRGGGDARSNASYRGLDAIAEPFDGSLPDAPASAGPLAITLDGLGELRGMVAQRAESFGIDDRRIADLVLAVNEVATNSLRHGGGSGVVRIWTTGDELVCEVADHGSIADPLVGRHIPTGRQTSGFGLWIVNQLCDLVQVRTSAGATVVRMHMRRA